MCKKDIFSQSYGVGRIKNGALTQVSGRVFWPLDNSVAIILRDLLRGYADMYDRADILGTCVNVEPEKNKKIF